MRLPEMLTDEPASDRLSGCASAQFASAGYVNPSTSLRINGAASITIGNIVTQDSSHDRIQFFAKMPSSISGRLATAAAMAQVRPDWMIPKTKWLYRLGIFGTCDPFKFGLRPGKYARLSNPCKSKEAPWNREDLG